MQVIPFDPKKSSRQTFSVSLGNTTVRMTFAYNVVSSKWNMTVRKGDGTSVEGIPVVPGYPLLRQYRAYAILDGDIVVTAEGPVESGDRVGYYELGTSYRITYLEGDELSRWERENALV